MKHMAMVDYASQVGQLLADAPGLLKIVIFFTSWLLLWLPIAIPLAWLLRWHPGQPLTVPQKLPLVCSLYLLAPLLLWGFAGAEGGSFAVYGLTWHLSGLISLGQGLAIAVIGLAILYGLQVGCGWLIWQGENRRNLWPVLVPTLLLGLWIGAIEELIFRGFLWNQLADLSWPPACFPPLAAAAVTSLVFALLHLVWEGPENIPQLPGLWLMGVVLCLARWVDQGNLGLAWGLHTGWIWGIACLDTAHLMRNTDVAPRWLTGVDHKPLAGLLGILFLAGTGMFLGSMCLGINCSGLFQL
jgi:uncharacterized protein